MKCMLFEVVSYEKNSKMLKLKNGSEYKIEVSKNHVAELQKSIKEVHEVPVEPAENDAIHHDDTKEEEEYQVQNYEEIEEEEMPPELPARASTPQGPKSPLSPVHAQLMSALSPKIGSPSMTRDSYVISLYDYVPDEEDELNVNEDEKLLLIDDSSDDWWLVQRLSGSKRKGLVPSSYLQRIDPLSARENNPLDEVFDPPMAKEADDEAPFVKSPKSPNSRPGTPVVPFSFLDELRARNQSREALSNPTEEVTIEDKEAVTEVFEEENQKEEIKDEEEDISSYRDEEIPKAEFSPVAHRASLSIPVEDEEAVAHEDTEKQILAKSPVIEVEVEPEIIRQPVKEARPADLNLPKLKPVGSPKVKTTTKGNFLEQILLKKQQDIDEGEIRVPEMKKAEEVNAVVVKPNPWKNLSMKTVIVCI